MRDRLIELLKEATRMCEGHYCYECPYDDEGDCQQQWSTDYLLDNDVIVPPCKVGDTIYHITSDYRGRPEIRRTEFSYFWLDYEIFLTKEEAEAKLAELKGE